MGSDSDSDSSSDRYGNTYTDHETAATFHARGENPGIQEQINGCYCCCGFLILGSIIGLISTFAILAGITTEHENRLEVFNMMMEDGVCKQIDISKGGQIESNPGLYLEKDKCVDLIVDYNLEYQIQINSVFSDTIKGNCTHLEQRIEMYQWYETENCDSEGCSYSYDKIWSTNYIDSDRFRGWRASSKYENLPFYFKPQGQNEWYETKEAAAWDHRVNFVKDMENLSASMKLGLAEDVFEYALEEFQTWVPGYNNYNATCIDRSLGNNWIGNNVHLKTASQLNSLYAYNLHDCSHTVGGGHREQFHEPEIGDYRFTATCLGVEAPHKPGKSRVIGAMAFNPVPFISPEYGIDFYKGTDLSQDNDQKILIWNDNVVDSTKDVIHKRTLFEIEVYELTRAAFMVGMVAIIIVIMIEFCCCMSHVGKLKAQM